MRIIRFGAAGLLSVSLACGLFPCWAQQSGLTAPGGLSGLYLLQAGQSRSISPENPSGAPGEGGRATLKTGVAADAGRDLGQGWKLNPYIVIGAHQTDTLAAINGSGVLEHLWMTPSGNWRFAILRMYWDSEKDPSVEVPLGDFFCMGWGRYAPLRSLAVDVNPGSGLNCYWPMPFRRAACVTVQNLSDRPMTLYFSIDYRLCQVPKTAAYFHAQFRMVKPNGYQQPYVILDGVKGRGQYVGTYLAWGVHNNGWWGEGEIKFFMDGDRSYPTINGTGTEDYFGGAYDFENPRTHQYETFTGPYSGLCQVLRPDGLYQSQMRFGMYRWHIPDPIRFDRSLKVTIQDLGWRENGTYLPQRSDISSVAYWYQNEPHVPFPELPSRNELEND